MTPQPSSLMQYNSRDVASDSDQRRVELAHAAIVPRRPIGTNTLPIVATILRQVGLPVSVRQIVILAGADLPTRSKTPVTVVARDLAMDIKKKGEASRFVRTAPGRFTLRELVPEDRKPNPSRDVVDRADPRVRGPRSDRQPRGAVADQ